MPATPAASPRSAPRLFVDESLSPGHAFEASAGHTHYLLGVLRRNPGDPVVLFNGRDGEWSGHIAKSGRRQCVLAVSTPLRAQAPRPDLAFMFAPLKRTRLDYLVQKATELGAGQIVPVITERTIVGRINTDRMQANMIEAAEQCGAVWVPDLKVPCRLSEALAALEERTQIVFCDEAAPLGDTVSALRAAKSAPVAVLVGPEGGFSPEERAMLLADGRALAISLGPRILRADTAGVAALALVQAVLGDWLSDSG